MKNRGNVAYVSERLKEAARAFYGNKVVLMFVVLCAIGLATTGKPVSYTVTEVFTRFGRNTFLVLALIIPVIAGLGLNFGIVVGAMAAQVAIFWTVYWGFTGLKGLAICLAMATPIAILFGYLVGRLYNNTKGAEMITGMIVGYFADGLYQLFFLFLIGGVIPVDHPQLIISGGVGVKNTIDLTGNIKYSIDTVSMLAVVRIAAIIYALVCVVIYILGKSDKEGGVKLKIEGIITSAAIFAITFLPPVHDFMDTDRLQLSLGAPMLCGVAVLFAAYRIVLGKIKKSEDNYLMKNISLAAAAVAIAGISLIPAINKILWAVHLPVATYALIGLLCLFNQWLLSTKLGQDMRTVGQSRTVANTAGINVNRTRIIAMCMSTVLASWGQIVYLQNLGTFSTYGAHTMVGQYAIAALLVGGASVQSANSRHAVLGVVLFHTLFVVSPLSATTLLGNPMIGEYFRVFICYGVIAVALAMHAWKVLPKRKSEEGKDGKGGLPSPEVAAVSGGSEA